MFPKTPFREKLKPATQAEITEGIAKFLEDGGTITKLKEEPRLAGRLAGHIRIPGGPVLNDLPTWREMYGKDNRL